jgi:hypothetical protein
MLRLSFSVCILHSLGKLLSVRGESTSFGENILQHDKEFERDWEFKVRELEAHHSFLKSLTRIEPPRWLILGFRRLEINARLTVSYIQTRNSILV